jgi:hypothetical protein
MSTCGLHVIWLPEYNIHFLQSHDLTVFGEFNTAYTDAYLDNPKKEGRIFVQLIPGRDLSIFTLSY